MLEYWIWLAHLYGVSEQIKIQLLTRFGSPEAVYAADEETLGQLDWLTDRHRAALADHSLERSRKIMETCLRKGIGILTYGQAPYPARLQKLPDAPVLLYFLGRVPDFDRHAAIGIVGTRNASAYGLNCAGRIGYEIAGGGGIVVSGGADGIDTAAMGGALTAGGPVAAVLGCGVDVVYPKKNEMLFRDTARFGCLLSEYPPGEPGKSWHFPLRNRIISGLSCGTLVVEAPEQSGALHTARAAKAQGRDVYSIPGNPELPSCAGSNALLRSGARAVSSGWEILECYRQSFPELLRKEANRQPASQPVSPPKEPRKPAVSRKKPASQAPAEEKSIDKKPSRPYSDLDKALQGLPEPERAIAAALSQGERQVSDVIAETGLPAGTVLASVTMLELKKVITQLPGSRIVLREEK